MAIRIERARKALRKLRSSLRNLAREPGPKAVHRLRTRARRVEALAAAWAPGGEKQARRLLESIRPVRKAAGRVRDMDVLADRLRELPPACHGDALSTLLNELRKRRKAGVRALCRIRVRLQKALCRALARCASRLAEAEDAKLAGELESAVRAAAQALSQELRHWPPLGSANLHGFRLKVKELRLLLQLLGDADPGWMAALGEARQQIGLWHDWQQLAEIAVEILDARKDSSLLSAIQQRTQHTLRAALATSRSLRKKCGEPRPPACATPLS